MSALPEVLYGRNSGHRTDDGLGSVRQVVTSAGASTATFEPDAFGVPLSSTGSADLLAQTYVGALGQRDEGGGLYYARQRWYDSNLGRWLSADPIGFKGGLNLFGYTSQNPINSVDPSGLHEILLPNGKKLLHRHDSPSEQEFNEANRSTAGSIKRMSIPPNQAGWENASQGNCYWYTALKSGLLSDTTGPGGSSYDRNAPFMLDYQGLQDLINYQLEQGNLRVLGEGESVGVRDIALFAPSGAKIMKDGRLDANFNLVPHCGFTITPFPRETTPALEQKMGKGSVLETDLNAFPGPTIFRWVKAPRR